MKNTKKNKMRSRLGRYRYSYHKNNQQRKRIKHLFRPPFSAASIYSHQDKPFWSSATKGNLATVVIAALLLSAIFPIIILEGLGIISLNASIGLFLLGSLLVCLFFLPPKKKTSEQKLYSVLALIAILMAAIGISPIPIPDLLYWIVLIASMIFLLIQSVKIYWNIIKTYLEEKYLDESDKVTKRLTQILSMIPLSFFGAVLWFVSELLGTGWVNELFMLPAENFTYTQTLAAGFCFIIIMVLIFTFAAITSVHLIMFQMFKSLLSDKERFNKKSDSFDDFSSNLHEMLRSPILIFATILFASMLLGTTTNAVPIMQEGLLYTAYNFDHQSRSKLPGFSSDGRYIKHGDNFVSTMSTRRNGYALTIGQYYFCSFNNRYNLYIPKGPTIPLGSD